MALLESTGTGIVSWDSNTSLSLINCLQAEHATQGWMQNMASGCVCVCVRETEEGGGDRVHVRVCVSMCVCASHSQRAVHLQCQVWIGASLLHPNVIISVGDNGPCDRPLCGPCRLRFPHSKASRLMNFLKSFFFLLQTLYHSNVFYRSPATCVCVCVNLPI